MIPIVASPSLLGPEARANIPTPVAIDYYRRSTAQISPQNLRSQQSDKNSLSPDAFSSEISRQQVSVNDTQYKSASSQIDRDTPEKSSRSISRGRQPKRRGTSANAAACDATTERATSADSIMNGILHTRVAKRHSNDKKDSQRPSHDGESQVEGLHSHSAQNESEFERIEVVSCSSCPVHGRQSASINDASKRVSDPTGQRRHITEGVVSESKVDSDRDVGAERKKKENTEANAALGQEASTGASGGIGYSITNEQVNGNGFAPLRGTVQTGLSSGPGPTLIQSTYNPSTPRAMIFHPNDTRIDTLPKAERGSDEKLPTWFTVERKMGDQA
jgi:protein N-terminal amidase